MRHIWGLAFGLAGYTAMLVVFIGLLWTDSVQVAEPNSIVRFFEFALIFVIWGILLYLLIREIHERR